MKYLLLFLGALIFWSCNNAPAGAQSTGTVVGKVNPRAPLRQEADDRDKKDADSFVIRMGEATAAPGDKVCLPVETAGFKQLTGLQFTMRFDSAALEFQSVRGMTLPGYSVSNFGLRFAERGYVTTLWFDSALKGQTQPDGKKLFEICFTNLQKPGEETEVKFQDGPTYFEVIKADMSQLRFVYANGKVMTK
ncbi:MAG: cohesin domain-containing protein [Bacteroidota bacterium]